MNNRINSKMNNLNDFFSNILDNQKFKLICFMKDSLVKNKKIMKFFHENK